MTTWQFTGMYTKLQANRTFHFFVIYTSTRSINRLQRTKKNIYRLMVYEEKEIRWKIKTINRVKSKYIYVDIKTLIHNKHFSININVSWTNDGEANRRRKSRNKCIEIVRDTIMCLHTLFVKYAWIWRRKKISGELIQRMCAC